jgi:hypothetical protein
MTRRGVMSKSFDPPLCPACYELVPQTAVDLQFKLSRESHDVLDYKYREKSELELNAPTQHISVLRSTKIDVSSPNLRNPVIDIV